MRLQHSSGLRVRLKYFNLLLSKSTGSRLQFSSAVSRSIHFTDDLVGDAAAKALVISHLLAGRQHQFKLIQCSRRSSNSLVAASRYVLTQLLPQQLGTGCLTGYQKTIKDSFTYYKTNHVVGKIRLSRVLMEYT